jgi:hypothetical protein
MDASYCRKRAEECVRAAQNAKPHHRALLLDIANKWLELTVYDEWTRDLLSSDEADKRPERRGPKDHAARPTRST